MTSIPKRLFLPQCACKYTAMNKNTIHWTLMAPLEVEHAVVRFQGNFNLFPGDFVLHDEEQSTLKYS